MLSHSLSQDLDLSGHVIHLSYIFFCVRTAKVLFTYMPMSLFCLTWLNVISAEFEQLLSLAQSRCYLKPYTRKQGYISLTKLIKIRNLCHKEVAFIAYCLAKRLNGLHEKGLVLQSLRGNDVHVRRDFQRVSNKKFCS